MYILVIDCNLRKNENNILLKIMEILFQFKKVKFFGDSL